MNLGDEGSATICVRYNAFLEVWGAELKAVLNGRVVVHQAVGVSRQAACENALEAHAKHENTVARIAELRRLGCS